MVPPTQIQIATSSLTRLLKEEQSYHTELAHQQTRLQKLESAAAAAEGGDEDGNREFEIRQEKEAVEETKKVFPPLRQRIQDALLRLEEQVESEVANSGEGELVTKARDVMEKTRARADA